MWLWKFSLLSTITPKNLASRKFSRMLLLKRISKSFILRSLKVCIMQLGFPIPGPGIPDDFRGNLNPGN